MRQPIARLYLSGSILAITAASAEPHSVLTIPQASTTASTFAARNDSRIAGAGEKSGETPLPKFATLLASVSTINPTWIEQIFPSLATSVQGSGIPGFSGPFIDLMINTTAPSLSAVFRIQRNDTYSGAAGLGQALWTACTEGSVNVTLQTGFIYCDLTTLDNWTTSTSNNMVAKYNQAFREKGAGPTWTAVDELRRYEQDPTGSSVTREIDMFGHRSDANKSQVGIDLVGGFIPGSSDTTTPSFGYALRIGAQNGIAINASFAYGVYFNPATYGTMIGAKAFAAADYGLDFSAASISTAAIRLASTQKECFEATNNACLFWNGTYLTAAFGSQTQWRSDAYGNFYLPNNVFLTNPIHFGSETGIAAAGLTMATATALTKDINEVTAGEGGVLLMAYHSAGSIQRQEVINVSGITIKVYPPTSFAQIWKLNGTTDARPAGVAATMANGTHATFECKSATLCYQVP